ncbi:hypothetical protein [Mesorhizobium sp. M0204]|uniref:hypothetical protein n=1 Tax=unclassified Mesorhizobium TaxID=325217 RepID=UPI0033371FDD
MRDLELARLRQFLKLDEEHLETVRRGAEGMFAWNVALEDAELADWTLVSDQFVQVGDDEQLATGLWENTAGVVVRTDVQAYRDNSVAVDALIARLAARQGGTYARDDPDAWTGVRFRSEDGATVVCLAANLVVTLILVEGTTDLVALSDTVVDSFLGDAAETEEEEAAGAPLRAAIGAAMPLDIAVAAATSEGRAGVDLGSIIAPPPDTRAAWPVPRTDRPTRVVVRSRDGDVALRDFRLRAVASTAGDKKFAITLKPHGAAKRRRLHLSIKVDRER